MSSLGERIKKLRTNQRLNITQLSRLSGISSATIGMVEKDKQNLDYDSIYIIALALKTDPLDLLSYSDKHSVENIPRVSLYYPEDHLTLNEIFARRLRLARRIRKVTQREVSQAIDTTEANISLIENAKASPDLNQIAAISKYLRVGVPWLLGQEATDMIDNTVHVKTEELMKVQQFAETSKNKKLLLASTRLIERLEQSEADSLLSER